MPRDEKARALMDAVLLLARKSGLSSKDAVRALLTVAATRAVKDQSFEDCVEFEDAAHDFFHSAQEVLGQSQNSRPPALKVVH